MIFFQTSVTIHADQGPLVRLRDDDGITHGEPDANEKSVAQPTEDNNIEGSRQTGEKPYWLCE